MTLHVRPAMRADVPAITRIYADAVTHGTASFELEAPDVAEMSRRFDTTTQAGFPYLVAIDDAAGVVGYAYANAYRPRPAYRFTVENSIYVAAAMHRRGIGQMLLSRLLETCSAQGFRQMVAVIGDSGQRASIGLHRHNGFTFSGTVHAVGFKHGRWLDCVLMQRALGEGDTSPPTSEQRQEQQS